MNMKSESLRSQAARVFVAVETIDRLFPRDLSGNRIDLTLPQLRTLMAMSGNNHRFMGDLARSTGYATSALTGIVDRMIKKGLVVRSRDLEDRRMVRVQLTKSGSRIADECKLQALKCISTALKEIDDSERRKMVYLVEKVAYNLSSGSKAKV